MRTIGRIAEAAGVSVETVRYYQREGILHVPARSKSGWRQYDDRYLHTIAYIKQGQRLGLSLAEIKQLLRVVSSDGSFCRQVRAVSRERLVKIEADLRELLRTRRELRTFVSRCETVKEPERCPIANALLLEPSSQRA